MNANSAELVEERIRDLWENTDFTSTLFGSLTGYAVIAADFDGDVIAYNEGARQVYRYAPEEVFGHLNVEAFFPTDFIEAGHFQRAVEALLATGRFEYEGEKVRKGGEHFPAHVLFTLTKDRSGKVVGFVEIVQDLTQRKRADAQLRSHRDRLAKANEELRLEITERKRAERRLESQHAVSRVLAESIRLADAAPRILQAVCEILGWDSGALWCVDPDAKFLRCVQVWPPAGLRLPIPVESGPPDASSRDGEQSENARPDEPHGRMRRDAVGFPISNGSEFLGVIELFDREGQRPDGDLVKTMSSISGQISQFIERMRAEKVLHEKGEELRVARKIQQRLIPRTAPELAGFDIHGVTHSVNETGGDYFDFLPMPDSCQGIVIADASGHGLGPALLIMATRAYLRAFASTHTDLGTVLSLVNRRLAEDIGEDNYVTLFLARLDPGNRTFVYTSAGHVTGYVLDSSGNVKADLESTGVPLGIDRDAAFPSAAAVTLEPGDLIVLLTDGILDACSPGDALFGVERALSTVRAHHQKPPSEIVHRLLIAVRDFCRNNLLDDLTAVIIKVRGHP